MLNSKPSSEASLTRFRKWVNFFCEVSQADLIETQKKLIESEHNLLTTQRQLTDNAVVVECLENKNSILSEELELNRQEREKIQQQLEKIRNRGILARIFNSEQ